MATSGEIREDASRGEPDAVAPPPGPGHRSPLAYVKAIGPGLVTGAADDDPSGIATDALAGALFRFSTLWVMLVSAPLPL